MTEKILDTLKTCSKDEESYQILSDLFSSLDKETRKYKNYLDLLEKVTRDDYDSILITGLDLEEPGPEIVYVNRGFTKMTGYTREEIVGKSPRILQGEKTDQETLDRLKQKLSRGESFFGHTVNYRKDGSSFVNQWDIHPLTDEQGKITHWVSFQHDITERKGSEKIWDDAQIEFDYLEEEVKSPKIDLDVKGNIVQANLLFRSLVKYGSEELNRLRFWELLDDESGALFRRKFDSFDPEDFADCEHDLYLITKNGETIEVRARTKVMQSHGQQVVRIHFSNRSLQKRIIEMLEKRNSKKKKPAGYRPAE